VLERVSGQFGVLGPWMFFHVGWPSTRVIVAGWSCARSYFDKGRLRGMEETLREISRGISSHCELEGHAVPERAAKAIKALKAVSGKRRKKAAGRPIPIMRNSGSLATRSARLAG